MLFFAQFMNSDGGGLHYMTDAILVALITSGLSLLGVIITCLASQRQIQKNIEISQAVTKNTLDELTREVREHNNFAKRMPVVENEISHIKNEISRLQLYHTSRGGSEDD